MPSPGRERRWTPRHSWTNEHPVRNIAPDSLLSGAIMFQGGERRGHWAAASIRAFRRASADRSVRLNGLSGEIRILQGNLRQILEEGGRISFPRAGAPGSFEELSAGGIDVVTSNPPYMKGEHGLQNPQEMKAISRHEILCTLPEVCAAAAKLLRTGGRFYMVHRPLRLSEIMEALRQNRLEPKRMKFVHPFIDREANMVLIEAVKDAKSQCRVEKPVIVYREPGKYTEEIYETYGY